MSFISHLTVDIKKTVHRIQTQKSVSIQFRIENNVITDQSSFDWLPQQNRRRRRCLQKFRRKKCRIWTCYRPPWLRWLKQKRWPTESDASRVLIEEWEPKLPNWVSLECDSREKRIPNRRFCNWVFASTSHEALFCFSMSLLIAFINAFAAFPTFSLLESLRVLIREFTAVAVFHELGFATCCDMGIRVIL